MFPDLCVHLCHDSKHLPVNQFILVKAVDNACAEFAIYHYISLFIGPQHDSKVFLIACRRSIVHYNTVLAKMGVQFNRSVEQGRCRVWGFSEFCSKNEMGHALSVDEFMKV